MTIATDNHHHSPKWDCQETNASLKKQINVPTKNGTQTHAQDMCWDKNMTNMLENSTNLQHLIDFGRLSRQRIERNMSKRDLQNNSAAYCSYL